ncbi:MAG: response regulator, partial [Zetaproteobacteria bacterium]|nr:response regulator [Zetaproteobacteria bacterium]
MKLLIVEDEKHIRQGIVDMLLLEGFDVYEADSVAQALNQLHHESMDAVLCDHHLPDGESFDVLLALSGEHPIPLIMMTAFGNRELVSKAFAAGV